MTFLYKDIYVVCERDRDREKKTDRGYEALGHCYIDVYLLNHAVPTLRFRAVRLFFFDETFSTGLRQGVTWPPVATLELQTEDSIEDGQLTVTFLYAPPTLRAAPDLRDWPLLWGTCVYNFMTPKQCSSGSDSSELLLLVYTGASCNHFVYTTGTSGSVKDQYQSLKSLNNYWFVHYLITDTSTERLWPWKRNNGRLGAFN